MVRKRRVKKTEEIKKGKKCDRDFHPSFTMASSSEKSRQMTLLNKPVAMFRGM